MTKVALRGLLSRKLRSVLTGFAVVIGVAFVVGTLVFTDTIDESFKNLFERTQQGVDVSVEGRQAVKSDFSVPPTMPSDTLEKVKSVPGVAVAEGSVTSDGTLLDKQGKVIVSQGPPTLIVSENTEKVFQILEYEEGGAPQTADEIALDRGTAERYDFKVGDKATVSGRAPAKEYTVSGVATIGGSDNLGGSRMIAMTLPEAQRVTGHDGFDSISISTGGEDPDTVKAAVASELGRDFLVRTGEEAAEQQAQDLSEALGFIRIALLIFAGVALLVGGFLIFNTFTVTVAQRTKEFALLRVLGASRGQILRSVLIETFAVGLLASIIGVLAGLVVAPALAALMKAGGIDLGTTGIVVSPMTVIIGLVIGLVATMVSGFVPALRATRVEPVTAMRDAVTPGLKHMGLIRIVGSGLLAAGGLVVLFIGLFGGLDSSSAAASLIGLGALLLMFAFAFLAPLLVRPLARVLGAPMARFQGLTGVLARENAIRQPQRTAVTAAALMVGLALVVLVAVFAAGLKATINGTIDDQVRASLVVQNQDGFSPIPADVVRTVEGVDGVTDVASMRFAVGQAKGDSGTTAVNGIDADKFNSVLTLNWVEGNPDTLSGLTDQQVIVESDWAKSHDVGVGGSVQFTTPVGREVTYEVAGTFKNQAGLTADVLLTSNTLEQDWNAKDIAYAMAASDPGTNADTLAAATNRALQGFPQTEALTREEFKDNATGSIDGLLGLVYGLLALSVLVALLGIVNTLALSVHERTRELGMLRAVGMTRGQVRAMVRAESVITAGIGAILGIVLGVVFALIISRPLAEQGFVFTLPIVTLIVFFVLAGVAGVVAAIPPARRAAKVDVLRAVTTE
ncbi:ABC transporter permease [Solirubrobacter sp. CPCC 204708]|uniref:ABC transporter permease n=1 Tax=Solirubrobacter deserti TaxID=2282478 RepID=A0ABT4RUC1_9ACTN|nr:FtsX-like permease family protein [Solirubrobacter deserti]MBE2314761.1 ABC transporter permease [Solirubrobacter deserti]MDA0142179.1 ABC transporter permease [Solirubrobacter deserti]